MIMTVITHILAFIGGTIMMYLQRIYRKKDRKEKIISRLKLIKHDVEKGKNHFENMRESMGDNNFSSIEMPMTFFKDIDYDEMRIFLGELCIEHIRNINEFVFDKWNKMIGSNISINDPATLEDFLSKNIRN